MSYFLYLRAVIHQGTDRKLMKKKGQRVLDMVLLCACLVSGYVCVCVCVWRGVVMQVFVSAFTQKHHIVSFFQFSVRFSSSWEIAVFQETQNLEISQLLGKIYQASLFFVQE